MLLPRHLAIVLVTWFYFLHLTYPPFMYQFGIEFGDDKIKGSR